MISLTKDGYFSRDRSRFIPVGVNYWPGSSGVEMWVRWSPDEIKHDLDVIAGLGLNAIRFFLRWPDFEPEPGQYDPVNFKHLGEMLAWCQARGLAAQPSLFVGFMSGGFFWPKWRHERNIYADQEMLQCAAGFARHAAGLIAPYHASLLGIDLGNELTVPSDSAAAHPSQVVNWCRTVTAAIRSAYPQAMVVSGTDHSTVINDTGWRLGEMPGTDYYSMHAYPVPAWHNIGFDGMTDPFCQTLLPSFVSLAHAYGPTFLQEFGTIVTFGAAQQEAYLRAILPACWQAGANGFLWWCLRDITARVHPYLKNGFEGTLGLVDANDRVKPGLDYFIEFSKAVQSMPPPDVDTLPTGIFLPAQYYPRENDLSTGQTTRELSHGLVISRYLLGLAGRQSRVVSGRAALDGALRTLVIPGALVNTDEACALETWVAAGGRLIWHAPDPVNWGPDYIRLLGAVPLDYRSPSQITTRAFGQDWTFSDFPRGIRVEAAPLTARVLARDELGAPVLLANKVGRGEVIYALPCVDETIARVAENRQARDRWLPWYLGMLDPTI